MKENKHTHTHTRTHTHTHTHATSTPLISVKLQSVLGTNTLELSNEVLLNEEKLKYKYHTKEGFSIHETCKCFLSMLAAFFIYLLPTTWLFVIKIDMNLRVNFNYSLKF